MRTIIGIFFLLHGLVHPGLASAPAEDSSRAFIFLTSPGHAWLFQRLGMGEAAIRSIGNTLWLLATAGFMLAGLSMLQVLLPFAWWRALAGVSAAVSLALLLLYWHSWYVVGTLLNLAILAAAVLRLEEGAL